jgi:hypothetical protein
MKSSVNEVASLLHRWHHDDYDLAKREIMRQLGSSQDLEVFGATVLGAMYVRPKINSATKFVMSNEKQLDDVYNGKAVLIIKCGPDAFKGTADWLKQQFGDALPPAPGDWCFVRDGSIGDPIWFCGDGAERVRVEDRNGEMMDNYPWDGWPCRVFDHMQFWSRMNKPHQLV